MASEDKTDATFVDTLRDDIEAFLEPVQSFYNSLQDPWVAEKGTAMERSLHVDISEHLNFHEGVKDCKVRGPTLYRQLGMRDDYEGYSTKMLTLIGIIRN